MTRKQSTKQVRKPRNPTGKGGFGDNPQNRSDGGWKKEDSISYQYNRLMRMTADEFEEFKSSEKLTMAQKIAINRIKGALKEDAFSLNETKEITDRTEGKAPQKIDLTSDGDKMTMPTFRIIDERPRHTNTK